jgi:hypothetical protein
MIPIKVIRIEGIGKGLQCSTEAQSESIVVNRIDYPKARSCIDAATVVAQVSQGLAIADAIAEFSI